MHLNFACILALRRSKPRRHYDRSPHRRTVSPTVMIASFIYKDVSNLWSRHCPV